MTVTLDEQEQRWLSGADGKAMQLAMQLVHAAAQVSGASRFVPIEMAHINSCHYSGAMSLDFAEFLLAEGATLAVPTHTNASLISCSSPGVRPRATSPDEIDGARRVMEIYEQLGCSSMWTCAPYQQPEGRPGFGQQIVGSESNAVGFFNSALGARTNKYGDLLDVSAAIVGRVPEAGLHTDEGRRATHLLDLSGLSPGSLADANLPHLLGAVLGREVQSRVGVIDGLASASEDDLKAIAAAAAAFGGVDLFHIAGITPEAPTVEAATQGVAPTHRTFVTDDHLERVRGSLTNVDGDEPLRAVCLGTPHFSVTEFEAAAALLGGRQIHPSITMIITTSRAVATELDLRDLTEAFTQSGVQVVLDTCTYYTPRPTGVDGLTMTNSAKWAYYAQGILEIPVAFASLERCIESAVAGRWIR
ncbi:MAG: aconitase X [Acidimicrobiia bacterium]|nr:aconitase X [Acidimicrobiia bacterium]